MQMDSLNSLDQDYLLNCLQLPMNRPNDISSMNNERLLQEENQQKLHQPMSPEKGRICGLTQPIIQTDVLESPQRIIMMDAPMTLSRTFPEPGPLAYTNTLMECSTSSSEIYTMERQWQCLGETEPEILSDETHGHGKLQGLKQTLSMNNGRL